MAAAPAAKITFDHFDLFYQRLGHILTSDDAVSAQLAKCQSDMDRVVFLEDLLTTEGVVLEPHREDQKDQQLAAKFLDSALSVEKLLDNFEPDFLEDKESTLEHLSRAIFLYGGAIRCGAAEGEILQKALLGRASLLFRLGHFEDALRDCQGIRIDPADVKLQCQLAIITSACLARSSRPDAEILIKSTLGVLSRSRLEKEEKASMAMRLVQQMKKLPEFEKQRPLCNFNFDAECPELLMGPHPSIPYVSAALQMSVSEDKGRFLVAATTIDAGSALIIDEPYAWMLSPSSWHDHCTHCCRPVMAPIPCPTCSAVCFCSPECQSAAHFYHQFECRLLHHFASSDELSAMALLVMRVVVRGHKNLARPEGDPEYARVHQQVTNSKARPLGDLAKRTATALFLARGLKSAGFSWEGKEVETALLRHLQSCSCNAYEISEHAEAVGKASSGEVVAIGGAVYSSISLANHACWSNVCRTSHGRRCVVRSTRRINAGEELLDNYGYSFLSVSKDERRAALRRQYFFECDCRPCQEDWPLFHQMNPNNKFQCSKCCKIGLKPVCKTCSPKRASKNVERDLRLAYDRCQVAMAKIKAQSIDDSVQQWLTEFIHDMQEKVVLPNKEFLIAQQGLIKTWGLQANRNKVLTFNEPQE